jgi:hypothetical protein
MKDNSKHWFSNSLISNIKYWLLGSFITFNVGWAVVICICILNICLRPYIFIVSICLGPFIGALIIKLIKKDMPYYFYITTGLIYGITFCCFVEYVDKFVCTMIDNNYNIKFALYDIVTIYDQEQNPNSDPILSWLLILIIMVCLASLLGGFIVDIYRYFKDRNSEPSSHLYE